MAHKQRIKLDQEPMGPRSLPLGKGQELLCWLPVCTCAKGLLWSYRRACKSPSATQASQSLPYYYLEGRAQPWPARTDTLLKRAI